MSQELDPAVGDRRLLLRHLLQVHDKSFIRQQEILAPLLLHDLLIAACL